MSLYLLFSSQFRRRSLRRLRKLFFVQRLEKPISFAGSPTQKSYKYTPFYITIKAIQARTRAMTQVRARGGGPLQAMCMAQRLIRRLRNGHSRRGILECICNYTSACQNAYQGNSLADQSQNMQSRYQFADIPSHNYRRNNHRDSQ